MGLCAAVSGWLVTPLPAAIVSVDLSEAMLNIPPDIEGLYINVVTGVASPFADSAPGWDLNPYNMGTGLAFFTPSVPAGQGMLASGTTALSLLGGEIIGPLGIYHPGQAAGSNFQVTGVSYAGFRFWNETTGALNYGWAEFTTTGGAGAGFPARLRSYAYEDAGQSLWAGQIPEPSAPSFLMLLMLAALAGRSRFRLR